MKETVRMRRTGRGWKVAVGATLALSILGSACAKKATPTAAGTPSQPSATASASTGGGYGRYGGTPSPSLGIAGLPGALQQGAGGYVFSPAAFSVKEGTKITVANVGSTPHTFTITGQGIDITNDPGHRQQVTIDLSPGTYQFICRFHVSFGMMGTITVTS